MKRHFLCVLLFCIAYVSTAQRITLNGIVFSFKGDKVMLLKKAQKNVSFDGSVDNATLTITGESGSSTVTTGLSGSFSIALENPGKYKLKLTKSGYSTIEMDINYQTGGNRSRFDSFFLILKQDDNSNSTLGSIDIADGLLSFSPSEEKSKSDLHESNLHLLQKTVAINKVGSAPVIANVSEKPTNNSASLQNKTENLVKPIDSVKSSSIKNSNSYLLRILSTEGETNMDSLKAKLADARKLLETMSPGSDEYRQLQDQIKIAEQKIKDKEALIAYQENEIAQANKIIVYMSLFAICALVAAFLLFYFLRQKKKHAAILAEKNTNITRMNTKLLNSIRYASLIQTSFLKDRNELSKLFPDSFILNMPKDILTGDFYWFTHKNGHRIMVVADCTGHGVPGAMLTVLGHNVLEDVIHVKGEVMPSKILFALHKALQITFARNTHYLEYGMDISVISIKDNSNELLLSGVNNGLYHFSNGHKKYYKVTGKTLGTDVEESDLKDQRIDVAKGDSIFMYSDGYMDQFGAGQNEVVKFNLSRFVALMADASKNKMSDSQVKFEKALLDWKGQREQTDDVCVVGIRF